MIKIIIKRLFIALIAVVFILSITACSSESTEPQDNTNGVTENQITNTDENVAQDDDIEPVDNVVENTGSEITNDDQGVPVMPENPTNPVNIEGWQGDMYWGTKDGVVTVFDSTGTELFQLPEGRTFEPQKNGSYYVGDYSLISDGGVVNKNGDIVFELSKSDYSKIVFSGCMDAGYLLCGVEVNTFADTSTHIFAVELQTREAYETDTSLTFNDIHDTVSGDTISREGCSYCGDGYFLFSLRSPSWGCAVFNMKNGTSYPVYRILEDGSRDETMTMPTYQAVVTDGMIYDYTDNNWSTGDTIFAIELESGEETIVFDTAVEFTDYKDISNFNGKVFVAEGKYRYEYGFLLNPFNKTATSISDLGIAFMEPKKTLDDGYFLIIKNDGGGKFAAVINNDGTFRFEPIPIKGSCLIEYNEQFFVVQNENDKYAVYDYDGTRILEAPFNSKFYYTPYSIAYKGDYLNSDGIKEEYYVSVYADAHTGVVTVLDKSINAVIGGSEHGIIVKYIDEDIDKTIIALLRGVDDIVIFE